MQSRFVISNKMAAYTVSALATIERLLDGKTTLKTQRATHSNIICIGTELLQQISNVMREDKAKAVAEAVAEAERRANAKLRSEIDLLTEILNAEKEREIETLMKNYEDKIKAVKRECELGEKKRAKEAHERFMVEKRAAINETIESEQKKRDIFVQNALEALTVKLEKEAMKEKERALAEQRKQLKEQANKDIALAIKQTISECDKLKEQALKQLTDEFLEKLLEVQKSLEYMTKMFEIEKKRKEDLQETFMELKEDYKRFQNYTGKFHSDYLLP